MEIKVIKVHFSKKNEPLKAFVKVQLGDLIVEGFRIIEELGSSPWVATPQSSWRDSVTGALRFRRMLTLPTNVKDELEQLILKTYHSMKGDRTNGEEQHS